VTAAAPEAQRREERQDHRQEKLKMSSLRSWRLGGFKVVLIGLNARAPAQDNMRPGWHGDVIPTEGRYGPSGGIYGVTVNTLQASQRSFDSFAPLTRSG